LPTTIQNWLLSFFLKNASMSEKADWISIICIAAVGTGNLELSQKLLNENFRGGGRGLAMGQIFPALFNSGVEASTALELWNLIDPNGVSLKVSDTFFLQPAEVSLKVSDTFFLPITQELVDGIAALAEKHSVLITVDPNPKNPILWKAAAAIKPNRKEAFEAAGVVDPSGNIDDAMLGTLAGSLFEKWGTEALLITLGDHGMALMERQSAGPYRIPTRAKEVFDVSGAGDTAIALFTLALTAGATTREAAELSNLASGVVVGKIGTATLTADELVAAANAG
jgi:hypothetical protein